MGVTRVAETSSCPAAHGLHCSDMATSGQQVPAGGWPEQLAGWVCPHSVWRVGSSCSEERVPTLRPGRGSPRAQSISAAPARELRIRQAPPNQCNLTLPTRFGSVTRCRAFSRAGTGVRFPWVSLRLKLQGLCSGASSVVSVLADVFQRSVTLLPPRYKQPVLPKISSQSPSALQVWVSRGIVALSVECGNALAAAIQLSMAPKQASLNSTW